MTNLLDVPVEIIIDIASFCSTAEINTLCQTCRALQVICTPQLYESIDLSSHNAPIECKPLTYIEPYSCMVPPDFIERHCTKLDISIWERQELLLRTFTATQAYGTHVRTLRWTILNTKDWCCPLHSHGEVIFDDEDISVFSLEDEPLWAMFRCLSNVSSVDLCWLRDWREMTLPGPLFPSLNSLRLSGCMSLEFVSNVLGLEKTSILQRHFLQHLDLNNLLEWAKINPPPPRLSHLRDLAHFMEANAGSFEIGSDKRPMLGPIDPLIHHLGNLRRLRIGTVGGIENLYNDDPHEDSVYTSWARLLSAVRPTLEEFYFDQGYNRNIEATPRGCRAPPRPRSIHRKMDELFVKNILPVLLEAPWPRIKRMHIRGVGRNTLRTYETCTKPEEEQKLAQPGLLWKVTEKREGERQVYEVEQTIVAVPMQLREHLRGLLGGNDHSSVEFVFEEEQGRDWECPRDGGPGIPDSDE